MMSQRYKFYPAICTLGILLVILSACGSSQKARSQSTEQELRTTVAYFIRAFNREDIKALEVLYADDFMSYAPLHQVSKKQLLNQIQKGFDQQNHKIKAKITEVISGPSVATAHLQWLIIDDQQEIIFAQNLLQVWKKEPSGWKLRRILFYTASEVPKLEDFDF